MIKNIVFCKYTKGKKDYDIERCYDCEKLCPSLSNIFYGKVIKLPVIKQIYNVYSDIRYKIQAKKYDKEYISECETTTEKFIWGVKSYDCISSSDSNLHTMNDIDLIYIKEKDKYILGIETIYSFNKENGECEYLIECLESFTKFMTDNNYSTDNKAYWADIFSYGMNMNTEFESIEECYSMFKILVNGYCS